MSTNKKVNIAEAKKILGWSHNCRDDRAIERLIGLGLKPVDDFRVSGERFVTYYKRDVIALRDKQRAEKAEAKAKAKARAEEKVEPTNVVQIPQAQQVLPIAETEPQPEPRVTEATHLMFRKLDNMEQRLIRIEENQKQILETQQQVVNGQAQLSSAVNLILRHYSGRAA